MMTTDVSAAPTAPTTNIRRTTSPATYCNSVSTSSMCCHCHLSVQVCCDCGVPDCLLTLLEVALQMRQAAAVAAADASALAASTPALPGSRGIFTVTPSQHVKDVTAASTAIILSSYAYVIAAAATAYLPT